MSDDHMPTGWEGNVYYGKNPEYPKEWLYPAHFHVRENGFMWEVVKSRNGHLGGWRVAGPFWSKKTALRVQMALIEWYRNGWDEARNTANAPLHRET